MDNTNDIKASGDDKAEVAKEALKQVFTLNREDLKKIAGERVSEITKEFTDGFEFLGDYPTSVTFFGSTMCKEDNPYYESARSLAYKVVKELGYSVLSGGGPGIMEAANRGAFEAGGNSLGLTISLPTEQTANKYITKEIRSYYFFVRKVCLAFSAEAFIFFPGGYGTLDEFFEILTLVQTGKITGVPIICVGSDYWNKLDLFIKSELLSRGSIIPEDLKLYNITDDQDEIIRLIKTVPIQNGDIIHRTQKAHPKE
ncbi:MAG: TIGR00730 family Rossman fold protein [bacterium]|nr:TIGR00730 family Rossman fold protein [bacterium]